MPTTIVIPDGLGYVVAAIVSTAYLNAYQFMKVGAARKAAKIPYPLMYADKREQTENKAAMVFNCTQRAHQNTLESLPYIYALTIITAIKSPIIASSLCGTWVVSRFLYTIGYSTGDANKRFNYGGGLQLLVLLGLMASSSYVAYDLVQNSA